MLLVERVQQLVDARKFPTDQEFKDLFCDGSSKFIQQEDVNWDFKDRWPFSYSDDYFLGLARLISAFANTSGGLIIFGVHDEKRTGGHNTVHVNTDKFRQSIIAHMGRCPELQVNHYDLGQLGKVDCLLVAPRKMGESPYKFTKDTKYKQFIWVRDGHSVAKAEPRHIPLLYCRVDEHVQGKDAHWLSGSLPPSPRTIGRFIGRVETMDYLFNWLYASDEPLTYVYGKGGSGKTTIAHEFASALKQFGADLRIYQNDRVDLVLFLSAKEKSFLTGDDSSIVSHDADFFDEKSLYAQILKYSGLYGDSDELGSKDLQELRRLIVEFFDEFASVIILDDIDTLTTKNVEVGTNYLNRMLGRAKRVSKILCPQRNIPTHAISNSVEVPGLSADGEYQEFVAECVSQYAVRAPSQVEQNTLATISERRPLVVEYIIALVRSCPNYEAAFRLFEGDTGNDIRSYVFKREWISLPHGPDARSMLAVLAILARPVSFADLRTILQFGEDRLRDAISAARAMFLQINDAGNETTYGLDVMTREFVLREAKDIDHISTIRARAKTFEKSYFPEVPQISRIAMRASDLVRKAIRMEDRHHLTEAWMLVSDPKLSASIVEHPQFKSIQGFVASKTQPPRLDDARTAFQFVMGTKYEPPLEHLRSWFDAERNSGIGFSSCIKICDFVSNGRTYNKQDKVDFASLKASSLFHRGRELAIDEPVDAISLITQALKLNIFVYKQNVDSNSYKAASSEKNVRNTTYVLLDLCKKNLHLDQTLTLLIDVLGTPLGSLDPLESPIEDVLARMNPRGYEIPVLHRTKKEISKLLAMTLKSEVWMDKTCFTRVKNAVAGLDSSISELLKQRP